MISLASSSQQEQIVFVATPARTETNRLEWRMFAGLSGNTSDTLGSPWMWRPGVHIPCRGVLSPRRHDQRISLSTELPVLGTDRCEWELCLLDKTTHRRIFMDIGQFEPLQLVRRFTCPQLGDGNGWVNMNNNHVSRSLKGTTVNISDIILQEHQ